MRVKTLIKVFEFLESERSEITLGPKTRLPPANDWIQLEATSGLYPLDFDLYVKTKSTNPQSLKRWTGFMAIVVHKKISGSYVTDVKYRLSDGTQELYYNTGAGAWVAASSNNWNTEEEIHNNINTFPVSNQTLQVIINLRTTNAEYTPVVKEVRVSYESDIEELEDYVWRSLLSDMEEKIRPIGEHAIQLNSDSSTIDLINDFPIETPYNISGIDSVYNLSSDQNKLNDLYQSYDSGTKVITLSSTQSSGSVLLIRFVYYPEMAVTTGQDYNETEKIPEIVLEDIKEVDGKDALRDEFVISKVTGAGKKVSITQSDVEISGRFVTNKAKDHVRLKEAIQQYFGNNAFITSKGLDENFRLWLLDDYDQQTNANQKDLHVGKFRFRIVQALFYHKDAEDISGVLDVTLTATSNV